VTAHHPDHAALGDDRAEVERQVRIMHSTENRVGGIHRGAAARRDEPAERAEVQRLAVGLRARRVEPGE
jgi:hypothetical protein